MQAVRRSALSTRYTIRFLLSLMVVHSFTLQSFSSIVGPNGSGKSNTIDALLFVFGYRASKMRQGKLSELIHNSARYPDLDECSVEVHFREIIDLVSPLFAFICTLLN
jgi:Fe-S cluster assembly ATPase SufC